MRTSAHRYQWGVCPRSNPLSFSRHSGPVSILRGNPPIRSLRNWQQPYGVVVLRQMNRFGASLNLFICRRTTTADEPFWSFAEPVPHKRQLFPWAGAVSIVVLGGIFAVLYGFNAPTSSRPHPTVATAGARTYRAVQHSAIPKDRKRLAVVQGSSIQVTVQ